MAVIRRIRLNILSKDDIRELEDNIIQLETLTKRKEAAQKKMQEVRSRKGKTVGPSGTIFKGTDSTGLPRTLTRREAKTVTERKADADAMNAVKAKDRSSAQAFTKSSPWKEQQKKIKDMDGKLDKTIKEVEDVTRVVNDPIAFIANIAGKQKFITRFFKVAAVIAIIHTMIVNSAKEMFGPGGLFDIRKLFRDETASINQLQLLIDIQQGKTFYTSDTRTFSHIVDNSSTQDLGTGDQLYKELNIGSDII